MKMRLKRLSIVLASIAIIFGAMNPLGLAYAAEDERPLDVIPNVQDELKREAEAALVIRMVATCFQETATGAWDGTQAVNPYDSSTWTSQYVFNQWGDDENTDVGAWLEKKLGGEGHGRGNMECTSGADIIALATSYLEIDTATFLFGDKDENGFYKGNGIFKKEKLNEGTATMLAELNISSDGYIWGELNDHWKANFQRFYDNVKLKNGWKANYSDIVQYYDKHARMQMGEAPGYLLYIIARQDLLYTNCANTLGDERTDAPSGSGYYRDFKSEGTMGFKSVYRAVQDSGFKYEYEPIAAITCTGFLDFMDEYYKEYEKVVKTRFNTACQKSIIDRRTEIEKGGDKLTPETITEIESRSDSKKYPAGSYPFLEEIKETDADGKETGYTVTKCRDIGGLLGATQEEAEEDENTEERIEASCYDNSGGIGWIVCPIIDFAGSAIPGMYEAFVENSLVLDASLFATGTAGGAGTRDAWSQILGYANILFIGFFLFVIFSQLTGIGLDNYGIKKVLPKLIMAAILINLSYFICQLAIDIANIIGHGIKGILANIGTIDASKAEQLAISGKGAGNVAYSGFIVAILVGLLCVGAVLAVGKYLLLVILMAVISIAAAVVSLFIMLAVRKAFAVMLVIVSPLAFVCYMLPNTKPIYQKWFRALKAVLLAYPICSLIIYGGEAVARLMILSAGSNNLPVWTTISAAIIGVVPIFFIPKILKSSMNAISGTIANATNRLGGLGKRKLNESAFGDRMRKNKLAHNAGIRFDENGNVMSADNIRTRVGKALAGKKGSKRRTAYEAKLNTLRGRALNQQIEDTYAGQFVGQGDKDAMNQYLAGGRAKKLSDTIGHTVDAINGGNFMTGDNGTVRLNPNDVDQLASALRQAIGEKGNDNDMKALMTVMSGTDAGRQAMRGVINAADSEGLWRGGLDGESREAAASHIMGQHAGTFKEADRTVYDWAKGASDRKRDENGNVTNDAKMMSNNVDTGKLKMDNIIGGDDDAMARLFTQASGDKNLQSQLQQMSREIMNDPKMLQGVDGNRRGFIEHMASGGSFDESHFALDKNGNKTSYLKPESVQAARAKLQSKGGNP